MSELLNDDLDLLDEDEDQAGDQKNPVKDLRARVRRLEKELKAKAAEAEELAQFKAQAETTSRRASIAQAFSSLGLPEAYAELYPSDAEPTSEAIQGFALKYGWVQPPEEEQEAEAQTTPTFSPVQIQGTSPVQKQITVDDLNKLIAARRDGEAAKAISEGRVTDLNTDW